MKIVLIGAGPRGLVAAERAIERQRQTHQYQQLKLILVDPFGVGGRVWQVDQPHELVMNTNPDYITLFTDQPNQVSGPLVSGPTLFDWCQSEGRDFIGAQTYANQDVLLTEIETLGAHDYASRSLYGAYLQWFYQYLQTRVDATIELRVLRETVQAVEPTTENILVHTSSLLLTPDAVVMALGHSENTLTPDQQQLTEFADAHHLRYVAPIQPQEYDFSDLQPQQAVILRGLGLSFFDAVTMLTLGRGGQYTRQADGSLVYRSSGREPKIVAGSRRGYPLHGKGLSDRPAGAHNAPHFLTTAWIDTQLKTGKLNGAEFSARIHHEIEYAYYQRLLAKQYPTLDAKGLLRQFVISDDPTAVIQQSAIAPTDYFDWEALLDPASRGLSIEQYLENDIKIGKQGIMHGPYAAAMAMYHDLYDQIRRIVDGQLLSDDDYYQYLVKQLNREHSFLSVGPPLCRIEQLLALIQAGVVTILGPQMTVVGDDRRGKFMTWSKDQPEQRYLASYLVEARLPAINAPTSRNPLTRQLMEDGLAQRHQLMLKDAQLSTGAVKVDIQTERLSPKAPNRQLYYWGVPTEGRHWLMSASPHPGINDVVLRTGDRIVEEIFAEKDVE